jgi:NADH dehydrogenase FAD-containing subunit
MDMHSEKRHQVVVVGGGYAGTLSATRLAARAGRRAQVTLVDAQGVLVQRLRLHRVAAGEDIPTYPLDRLTGPAVRHVHGRATAIDLRARRVAVAAGDGAVHLPWDTLVLATGSTADTDAVPGVRAHAHSLADPDAALRLRAALGATPAGGVVAVVGGGMTGIEAATELAEARPDLTVRMLTSGRLGGWLSEAGRAHLERAFRRLRIDVVEDASVTAVEPGRLALRSGAHEHFDLAVWCGGFAPTALARTAGLDTDARGAVVVDATLRSVSHPDVLAIGDAAAPPPQRNGAVIRMSCQSGMPTGAHAADVVAALLRGRTPRSFDFGWFHQPISLGRRDALIQFVDRTDAPRDQVLTGRLAVAYKELVSSSPMPAIRLERRFPGATRWFHSGATASARAAREAGDDVRAAA